MSKVATCKFSGAVKRVCGLSEQWHNFLLLPTNAATDSNGNERNGEGILQAFNSFIKGWVSLLVAVCSAIICGATCSSPTQRRFGHCLRSLPIIILCACKSAQVRGSFTPYFTDGEIQQAEQYHFHLCLKISRVPYIAYSTTSFFCSQQGLRGKLHNIHESGHCNCETNTRMILSSVYLVSSKGIMVQLCKRSVEQSGLFNSLLFCSYEPKLFLKPQTG